jgi:hypothetical protein
MRTQKLISPKVQSYCTAREMKDEENCENTQSVQVSHAVAERSGMLE